MEFDSLGPVSSGLIGGAIAVWLTSRWARTLPRTYNAKSRDALLRQHRLSTWVANALFIAGIFFGVALYPLGGYEDSDPVPVLWGFGLASVLPLLALGLIPLVTGRNVKEAYVAFAWAQDTPLWLTYSVLGGGVVAFAFALASLRA
ncbi:MULTISPECIES: hypothetical protein [unclassified Lysobacter]|uniref:hypothetical protein n=1 Tax=unclassified Lysobacter TaxID=2635362 RepID=UPI0006F213A6|nr:MULTISPECIES: hypothetical protein [unclassified Lysobacter]KRA17531.1 hypothetical protein ASD69_12670 [Lysobacter sp. Root604]KRD34834.1 hypothetical protein ASE35_08890 [Lysobacter sp. Root916]